MLKDNILISIIVPVYNVEKYLDRCVESIVNQTYKNIEIVLIDDGATDSSGTICDKWGKIDSRIKVIHKTNGGLSDARNIGLLESNGEYVLFIDSDDYIELDSCERFLSVLSDDIDFIVGSMKEIRKEEVCFQSQDCFESGTIVDNYTAIIALIDNFVWYAPAQMKFYKKDFLLKNNLLFLKGIYFEDLEILPRLYLNANKICFLQYDFYNYVIRDNSIMTSNRCKKKKNDLLFILTNWKKLFDSISDKKLQRKLYGILIKQYLYACRFQKIEGWEIENLDFKFAFKYALNLREKAKVLYFQFFPDLYIK